MNRMLGYLIVVFTSIYATNVLAQSDLWQTTNTASRASNTEVAIQYFDSDDQALRSKLNLVPNELRGQTDTIQLPMPDGTLAEFTIVESSIMEDGLAAKFPNIKSYKVYGLDDPSASGRVDISPKGFRGMLMTSQGRIFIDPDQSISNRYVSHLRNGRHAHADSDQPFQCSVYDLPNNRTEPQNFSSNKTVNRIPGSLITYRLAVSATPEYVDVVDGGATTTVAKVAAAIAEINTAINRVNVIYERDLGIKLLLIANNSLIVDADNTGANAGFIDNDPIGLLTQNQAWIDAQIGNGNYDIGHVFSTGGGGVASLQSVCSSTRKARGVTGLPNPTGDSFYIDYVAHEIGHQFGGNHSYNGSEGSCGGQRNPSTAFEPGSGTTIMGYAGICASENVQTSSDATFHAGTIAEINAFVSGSGSACAGTAATTPAGNSDPTSVNAGLDQSIPKGTAFRLEGSATDPNLDTLLYQWDQMDTGVLTTGSTIGNDLTTNALYRTFVPDVTSSVRDFPAMSTQRSGIEKRGEALTACVGRVLNFRLTARDSKSGQGTDDVRLTVDNSGPFAITSHTTATTFAANTLQTVSWDVAGTTATPVSCANVNIELLNFSADGSTYGTTLLETAVINSGTRPVTIPNMTGTRVRFRVSCSNNIFYDISDVDLTVTGGGTAFPTIGSSTNIFANSAISSGVAVSQCNAGGGTTTIPPTTGVGGGSAGGGITDNSILAFLFSLILSGFWLRSRKLVIIR